MNVKIVLGILMLALASMACYLPVLATPAPEATPTEPNTAITPTTTADNGVPPIDATDLPSPADTVDVFLIKLEDNGQSGTPVGCGDSLVAMGTAVPVGQNSLTSAYSALFAIRDQRVGPQGLYNALYQSNLLVRSSQMDGNGRAEVWIDGTYALGGVCDTPRFIAQLEAAALQFPDVKEVQVYLNDVPIEQALSGQ